MSQAENLAPSVISRLLSEIRELRKNPPDGVSYVENEENSVSEIHAVMSGPEGTPFVGGRFRMKLVMSHEYPSAPPKGFFLTKIYHPNVAANGDICVNTLKKDWTPDTTRRCVVDGAARRSRGRACSWMIAVTRTRLQSPTPLMQPRARCRSLPSHRPLPRELAERRGRQALHGEL